MGGGFSLEKKATDVDEKFTTISLTKDQLQELSGELKELFASYPGKSRVYLDVEGKRVKTEAFVEADTLFEEKLAQLLS